MNLNPILQTRVRQLLGLTGAPSIEGIPAIQPVAIVGGYPDQRQPAQESGDAIVRRFTAWGAQGAVVAEYPAVQLRVSDANTLVWLQRIVVPWTTAAAGQYIRIGRAANIVAGSFGSAAFNDLRLPAGDLGNSLVTVAQASLAAEPTILGRLGVIFQAYETQVFEVDYILVGSGAAGDEGIVVVHTSTNSVIQATFEGVAFSRGP